MQDFHQSCIVAYRNLTLGQKYFRIGPYFFISWLLMKRASSESRLKVTSILSRLCSRKKG